MSSRKVTKITDAAIIVANDLRTGRTVYLAENGRWKTSSDGAITLRDEEVAQQHLSLSVSDPDVLDPYLVNTDKQGRPVHIREVIRTRGPSIDAGNKLAIGESRVSV